MLPRLFFVATLASVLLVGRQSSMAKPVDPAAAQASPHDPAAVEGEGAMVADWGRAVDPNGDCTFYTSDGKLLIHIPAGPPPHGFAAENRSTDAPRVLRDLCGDFTIQVQVDGRFSPGDESAQPGRTAYQGAALVAMAGGPENAVTLARAVLQRPGSEAAHYANFEIRIDGELQRMGLPSDGPLPATGPVYLRLERRGNQMQAATSTDGVSWTNLPPKELPADCPDTMQVGIVALSTSHHEFNPRFSDLQVLN